MLFSLVIEIYDTSNSNKILKMLLIQSTSSSYLFFFWADEKEERKNGKWLNRHTAYACIHITCAWFHVPRLNTPSPPYSCQWAMNSRGSISYNLIPTTDRRRVGEEVKNWRRKQASGIMLVYPRTRGTLCLMTSTGHGINSFIIFRFTTQQTRRSD